MEKIRPELLRFLAMGDMPYRILVVESCDYLKELRERFPKAELYAVVHEEELAEREEYRALDIHWSFLDIYSEPLPFPKEYFDYIISDLTLEQAGNPQDIAAGFGMFLKQTGEWLTSFRNIRHWSVLQNLMEGHYYSVARRLYAVPEFENLLYASFYKDVRMLPQMREGDLALIQRLIQAGFDNFNDDMDVEFWLVRAAKSMPEMSLLKSMFTADERKTLSRLLHRIEYAVDTKEQCAAFWRQYDEMGLFPEYTAAFIKQAVFFPKDFYEHLLCFSDGRQDIVMDMIRTAISESNKDEERDMLQELLAGIDDKEDR